MAKLFQKEHSAALCSFKEIMMYTITFANDKWIAAIQHGSTILINSGLGETPQEALQDLLDNQKRSKTIQEARAVIRSEFKKDPEWKRSYIDNVACADPVWPNAELVIQFDPAQDTCDCEGERLTLPFAILGRNGWTRITTEYGTNNRVTGKGGKRVRCYKLDVFKNYKPDFICMDIEGAEPEALRGAEKLIKKYRPDLAISVYHHPLHCWSIPLWINSLKLGYKFYLRNYSGNPLETVMYAVQQ